MKFLVVYQYTIKASNPIGLKRTIKFIAFSIAISLMASSIGLSMKMQEQERLDQEPANTENSDSEDTQPQELEFTSPISSDTVNLRNEKFTDEDILIDNSDGNKQPAINPEAPKEEEEGQSILSFNFIFYFLQKFKFSDLLSPTF